MERLSLRGKTVELAYITGETGGCTKRSDSYTSGSGGGSLGNGQTQPVTVSTVVVVRQEFFVKDANGREHASQFSGVDIPLRDGQRVTVISATTDQRTQYPVHLVNHTAGQFWAVNTSKTLALWLGIVRRPLVTGLIGFGIYVVISIVGETMGLRVLDSAGFFIGIGYVVREYLRNKSTRAELQQFFDSAARTVLASPPKS